MKAVLGTKQPHPFPGAPAIAALIPVEATWCRAPPECRDAEGQCLMAVSDGAASSYSSTPPSRESRMTVASSSGSALFRGFLDPRRTELGLIQAQRRLRKPTREERAVAKQRR